MPVAIYLYELKSKTGVSEQPKSEIMLIIGIDLNEILRVLFSSKANKARLGKASKLRKKTKVNGFIPSA